MTATGMRKTINKQATVFFNERIAKPWPLVRIGIWFVVFLALIGWWAREDVFETPTSQDLSVVLRVGDVRDSTGLRPCNIPKTDDQFRICWVSGSSVRLKHPPDPKLDSLIRMVGVDLSAHDQVAVLDYSMDAARIFETYLCVLDALQNDPDLLVITVNAFWFFCNKAATFHDNMHSDAPALLDLPAMLRLWAPLATPSSMVEGVVSPVFPGLEGRYFELKSFLRRTVPRARTSMSTTRIQQPLYFWLENELGQTSSESELQRRVLLEYFDSSPRSLNMIIFKMMADAVLASGVPTVWYIPPVRPDAFEDPEMARQLAQARQALVQMVGTQRHKGTSFILLLDQDHGMSPDSFTDYIHLKTADERFLGKFLASFRRMREMVKAKTEKEM